MVQQINLGPATAYAQAVEGGYTGTKEQFETDLGNSAANSTSAALSASAAQDYAELSEAYAKGTVNGVSVQTGDPGYHDNSKFYRDQAASYVGSPLVASTVAGMTDQTKIYVYTGTETGYTAGNWYYYDGTSWQSGGAYNSTSVDTDASLSIANKAADAAATGAAIETATTAINKLTTDLAPAYSSSSTYAVGDKVTYNNTLYRCKTAISTAEAFTSGHWESINVSNEYDSEISNVKSQLDNNAYKTKARLVSALNRNRFDGAYGVGYTLDANGLPIARNGWVTTDMLYVGDLSNIVCSGTKVSSGNRAYVPLGYLCTYDFDGTFIAQRTSSEGRYTLITGEAYIRFSFQPDVYINIQVEGGSTRTDYTPYNYDVLVSADRNDDIAITKHLVDVSNNSGKVDITSQFALQAGYIDKANGLFVSYASAECTDFLNIFEYPELYISGSASFSSNCLYALYDISKKFIDFYKDGTSYTDYHFSFTSILSNYPNAVYVRFNSITTGSHLVIKRPYTMSELVQTHVVWSGKKWVCVGDSLTEVNSRTTKHYYDYVSEKTGVTVVNLGKSGRGYKNPDSVTGSNKTFYQVVSEVPTDADVVTIFGSGNDLTHGYTLGTVTDTGTETICGCINTTLDTLIARIPTVQLGIVAPTPWVSFPPSTANNAMAQYVDALKTICENRSIPFLDLYHCSNLRPWTAEGRAACYSKDDGNGVHPDEEGHKLIAPRFKGFLDFLLI